METSTHEMNLDEETTGNYNLFQSDAHQPDIPSLKGVLEDSTRDVQCLKTQRDVTQRAEQSFPDSYVTGLVF